MNCKCHILELRGNSLSIGDKTDKLSDGLITEILEVSFRKIAQVAFKPGKNNKYFTICFKGSDM